MIAEDDGFGDFGDFEEVESKQTLTTHPTEPPSKANLNSLLTDPTKFSLDTNPQSNKEPLNPVVNPASKTE